MIDGVLVLDKPSGITSHDAVAAARRALRERRIGHTGTLDPMATGVLPLACGRATRLVQFLTASDKDYDAEILFGRATDSYDVTGREVAVSEVRPGHDALVAALATLTGHYLQAPPPVSAKKIGGTRAYTLARRETPVQPRPVPVSVTRADLLRYERDVARVGLTCSAGFYVRAFAHELGLRLGTFACLKALRRTRSGDFGLSDAVTIEALLDRPEEAAARLVRLEELLPAYPAVVLTGQGRDWVAHGREVGPAQTAGPWPGGAARVRLLGPDGALLAVATPGETPGALHPSVVLI